jgi:hypothetical protein
LIKPFSSDFPRLYSLTAYVQENFLPRRLLAMINGRALRIEGNGPLP